MKKINFNYITRKTKVLAGISIFILSVGLLVILGKEINTWYDAHYIQFNKVFNLEVKKPFEIKKREVQTREIVKVIGEVPEPKDLVTDAEKYIFEKFGIEDYKIAISIAKAESGLREDAIHINNNGTIDVGIFQINSIHFTKEFCQLKDVASTKGNIDCAYEIYKASGWSPWVAFNNGNFKNEL